MVQVVLAKFYPLHSYQILQFPVDRLQDKETAFVGISIDMVMNMGRLIARHGHIAR